MANQTAPLPKTAAPADKGHAAAQAATPKKDEKPVSQATPATTSPNGNAAAKTEPAAAPAPLKPEPEAPRLTREEIKGLLVKTFELDDQIRALTAERDAALSKLQPEVGDKPFIFKGQTVTMRKRVYGKDDPEGPVVKWYLDRPQLTSFD